MQLIDAIFNT